MASSKDIRRTFLDFFKRHGHMELASAPLVPQSDPTLLFTNAGMAPLKNYFTEVETPPARRLTTCQKCVRAGGKHNDLENVGYTARHHTFFEMLGNFSLGDYFKEEAIKFAWDLSVKEYGLPKDKIWVTIFRDDDEAHTLWKKISGLPDSRIVRLGESDNFWSMGDTGPCGPCSEIFIDQGDTLAGGPPGSPEADGPRYLEFWNNVFMQFEQIEPGKRVPLPKPSIDTGMGLERISAILQGKHNNYDIDSIKAIVDASSDITGVGQDSAHIASHRVIADHMRCAGFLIADGVLPSNEGRGYVLRRILRRAMRHAHLLGAKEPMMHRLVPVLLAQMGDAYPELIRAEALMRETLKLEEENFKRTLDKGLRLLTDETEKLAQGKALSGEVAFKLYDTYGFPIDLTQDILRAQHRAVDMAGFDTAMAAQKAKARAAWKGSGDAKDSPVWFDLYETCGDTEFLGYTQDKAKAKILALVVDGKSVPQVKSGQDVIVITNQTPFYGESGGQVGDTGVMVAGTTHHVVTNTTKKFGGLFQHHVTPRSAIRVGDDVSLEINAARRQNIRVHHSVTHLLHAALRETLGTHVTQKGSLQDDQRTRFDISHPKAMTEDERRAVEDTVNHLIRANSAVTTRVMTPKDAMDKGAMALFGEKYGDEVRVVAMGDTTAAGKPYSLELCGGTHVRQTGEIGLFKILSEGAVASGVRRIEAVAGAAALTHIATQEQQLAALAETLKVAPLDVVARVNTLLEDRKKADQDIQALRKKLASGGSGDAPAKNIGGVTFKAIQIEDMPARDLRTFADEQRQKIGSGVVAAISGSDGKASLVVAVTGDLLTRFNAVTLAQLGAEVLGGKGGGGKPDLAQAGGPSVDKANDALQAIERALAG